MQVGKWKGCINVPLVLASWKYNAEERKKEVVKEDNPDFVAQVGSFNWMCFGCQMNFFLLEVVKEDNPDCVAQVQ